MSEAAKKPEDEKRSIPEIVKERVESGRAKILLFEDEAKKFAKSLIEKGRASQAEGKKRFEEFSAIVKDNGALKQASALRKELEEQFGARFEKLLEAFGLPSKEEVQKLSQKLDSLGKRVAEMGQRVRKSRRSGKK